MAQLSTSRLSSPSLGQYHTDMTSATFHVHTNRTVAAPMAACGLSSTAMSALTASLRSGSPGGVCHGTITSGDHASASDIGKEPRRLMVDATQNKHSLQSCDVQPTDTREFQHHCFFGHQGRRRPPSSTACSRNSQLGVAFGKRRWTGSSSQSTRPLYDSIIAFALLT